MNSTVPGDAWTAPALRVEIETFIAAQHTVALATVADDGSAHGASLLYAPDGLGLVWTSDPLSRHSRYLGARPRVTATIAPEYNDFALIRGVQMAGEAVRMSGAIDIARACALLMARYPFLAQLAGAPAALRAAWDKASFYRLTPSRIALIDNTRGFGHKATLLVNADGNLALERKGSGLV